MQSLWSRAASAQSTCRCVSCLSTAASGLASRGTSAASKRRLRIGNSVTALYTSIFAGAAVADAKIKEQRRLEWKEKIAAVREEVNELVDEEQRLLEALASRRKPRTFLGIGSVQKRQYNTSAAPIEHSPWPTRNETADAFHTPKALADDMEFDDQKKAPQSAEEDYMETYTRIRESAILSEISADNEDPLLDNENEEHGLGLDHDILPDWFQRDLLRQKAVRKLALKQLAIRLLLRPTIAHTYQGLRVRYDGDHDIPNLKVTELVGQLTKIRHRMRQLKTIPGSDIGDLITDFHLHDSKSLVVEKVRLDKTIRADTEAYLDGFLPLQELLLRLSHHLLNTRDPDVSYCMRVMILAFTKTRQNDLAELVLKTVLPHKFPLSTSLINTILTFYRKSKNLKGFDMFLDMLRGDGYPVNLQNIAYYKRRVINGVEITVPPVDSANAVSWDILIMGCLRFDQPDRADAYLQAARASGYMDSYQTLSAYLKFYADRGDWERGVQVLKRSLAFITSSTDHPTARVERLLLLMVHLCDGCRKLDVSEAIITAAINSGFEWRDAAYVLDLHHEIDPHYRRWQVAEDMSSAAEDNRNQPLFDKSYLFAEAISDQLNELAIAEHRGPANRWQKLMGLYSQEILSSVLSSGPAKDHDTNHPTSELLQGHQSPLKDLDIDHDNYKTLKQTTESQKEEITSLKDEISGLKSVVVEFRKSTFDESAIERSISERFAQLKLENESKMKSIWTEIAHLRKKLMLTSTQVTQLRERLASTSSELAQLRSQLQSPMKPRPSRPISAQQPIHGATSHDPAHLKNQLGSQSNDDSAFSQQPLQQEQPRREMTIKYIRS